MTSTIMLACIIILPIAVFLALRINATLVFLSLCLGDVLAQFVVADANSLTGLLSSAHVKATINPTSNTWRIGLILLPTVITAVIMVHTIKGNSKMILNILPAAGVGLVGALLVVPLLPLGTAQDIVNTSLWSQITRVQDVIVGGSALACLSVLWLQRPKVSGKHGKHGS
jgi:hypothetical protein